MSREPDIRVQRGSSAALRLIERICLVSAGLGGVTIFVTALVVSLSVILRNLGFGGFTGDFEMVEIACCLCASLFLPLCQLRRGHVMVDLFTNWLHRSARAVLEGIWELLFAAALAVLAWRLSLGAAEMLDYGDRTMLLGVPVWLIYLPAIFGTALSALIALMLSIPMLRGHSAIVGARS